MAKKSGQKKIIVAMSGGVDSSVAAALLKRAVSCPELGRRVDVVGVFMKFWSEPGKNGVVGVLNRCCSPESEVRARAVAKILKIPFYVFNFEKEFKKRIVDYFLKEYKRGETPNPCVVCNKEIKFGLLLEKAQSLGADYVATGHYARLKTTKQGVHLLKGADENKDQSYFLHRLNQNQLKHVLFPVGHYLRSEVEALAREFKLPFKGVKKSQEVCFIPARTEDFLKKYLKEKPGKIADEKGKIIGEHKGLWFYTIGQRKGLGLGGPAFAKASAGKPYYVLKKDFKKNVLIVTKNKKDLAGRELIAKNVSWIAGEAPLLRQGYGGQAKQPLKIKAKIRYRHEPASATVTKIPNSKSYILKFKKPQPAITSGQSVVFLKGSEILGGGTIG